MNQQEIKHRKQARKLRMEAANRLLQSTDWRAVLSSLEEEANDFRQAKDWVSYTFLVAGIIPGLVKKEEHLEAEVWCKKLEEALVHLEELYICRVYLHEHRAMLFGLKGNLEDTLKQYQKAIHILQQLQFSSPSYLVKLMGEVGNLFIWKEDYSSAKIILQQALNLQSSSSNADPTETAIIYLYLSVSQISLKDFDASFDCLTKSLALLQEHLPEDDPDILFAHAHFSNYYLVKAQSHNLSTDYQQIIHYCNLILESKTHTKERYATDSYQNLGFAHTELGNWQQAEFYLHKSLEAIRSYYGFEHPQLSDSYKLLGICYRKQGQWEDAKQHFQLALNILYPNKNIAESYTTIPPMEGYINPKVLLEILLEKGRTCYDAALQQKNHSLQAQTKDLQISIQTFDSTCRLLDKMRTGFNLAESKLLLTQKLERGQLFELGVKASLQAAKLQLEVDGKNGQDWAFDFCEKAKANILIQALQDHLAKASSNLPKDVLQRESQLQSALTHLDKNIQTLTAAQEQRKLHPSEVQQLQKWQAQFFEEYKIYTELKKRLEEKHPDYFQLKYNIETTDIPGLQKQLEENQVLLNYYISKDRILLFVCTCTEFEVLQEAKPSDFETTVEQFLQAIKHHDQAAYVEKAAKLYALLLQSAEDYFIDWIGMEEEQKHLIIIPDGVLSYIPFEALLRTATTQNAFSVRNTSSFEEQTAPPAPNNSYQNLDYLLKHALVSYHYSATLFVHQKQKRKEENTNDALKNGSFAGFAPIYSSNEASDTYGLAWATRSEAIDNKGTFVPLPYSKLEVENIAELFAAKGLEAKTYLYQAATKEEFAANAKHFRFLLVAAHGVVNDEKTALSGLVFSLGKREKRGEMWEVGNDKRGIKSKTLASDIPHPTPQTDTILSMEETYHLDLSQTDLVVLSSCDSGIGRLVKGEGMMAVNRGFLYAGA
ncbi:MAG: CHAT domain-containing protein, partial [Chitinophagales bacterium]